ncbi:MAG: NRDE family protein [Planctomycetes bacterium]|nr:NRDE family protein [Planctomycetota bacterium]
MCLLVCAWRILPETPLLVLANRDEFHARPTAPLALWEDGLLAGRDLQAGGTWLGVQGRRFAALTNIREPSVPLSADAPSRGELVPRFLRASTGSEAWLGQPEESVP